MRTDTDERALLLGRYIADTGATVRAAATWSGVPKSTVHTDVTRRLRNLDAALYAACRRVLDENRAERHLRGGDATRRKYGELRGCAASN